MRSRNFLPMFVLIAVGFLSLACLLPGMIPITGGTAVPTPTMEKDADKVLEVLKARNYIPLVALVKEQYPSQAYAQPGTLTFTAKLIDKTPIYFSYGWCAADETTLQQNLGHIQVSLYFNGAKLSQDVVHSFSFTSPNNQICGDLGVLLSDWPAGQYKLKSVATFDQKINDGIADYAAGDYIQEFTVDVPQEAQAPQTPTPQK